MFRRRFRDVIARQLDMFEREHAELIEECEDALRAHRDASREDAEELYGDYLDLVETGAEALAELRDTYAATLDEDTAEEYVAAFNRGAGRRLPRFAPLIGD